MVLLWGISVPNVRCGMHGRDARAYIAFLETTCTGETPAPTSLFSKPHARARRPRLHLFSRITCTGETPAPTSLTPKSWSNSHCAHHAPGHAFLRTKGK